MCDYFVAELQYEVYGELDCRVLQWIHGHSLQEDSGFKTTNQLCEVCMFSSAVSSHSPKTCQSLIGDTKIALRCNKLATQSRLYPAIHLVLAGPCEPAKNKQE